MTRSSSRFELRPFREHKWQLLKFRLATGKPRIDVMVVPIHLSTIRSRKIVCMPSANRCNLRNASFVHNECPGFRLTPAASQTKDPIVRTEYHIYIFLMESVSLPLPDSLAGMRIRLPQICAESKSRGRTEVYLREIISSASA